MKRRILPEEVQEAYQKTGLIPAHSGWGSERLNCACALTAVIKAQNPDEHFGVILSQLENEGASILLGIDVVYSTGFTNGFDSHGSGYIKRLSPEDKIVYEQAYADGVAARELMNPKIGLNIEDDQVEEENDEEDEDNEDEELTV